MKMGLLALVANLNNNDDVVIGCKRLTWYLYLTSSSFICLRYTYYLDIIFASILSLGTHAKFFSFSSFSLNFCRFIFANLTNHKLLLDISGNFSFSFDNIIPFCSDFQHCSLLSSFFTDKLARSLLFSFALY